MKPLALILCLTGFAAAADAPGPDEPTRIEMVEYMLKTPLKEADPSLVSGFMKLDPETLPKKLRDTARGKQMEIDAIVKIHKGRKRGPLRDAAPSCTPKRYGPEGVKIMSLIIGNVEIEGDEEEYLEKTTGCPEDQLICEFSLNVVVIPRPGKPPKRRYYLMETDPLMALVAQKRNSGASGRNLYFQESKPSCKTY